MDCDRTCEKLQKNKNTAGQDISFVHISRKPMIQPQYMYCAILSYIHDSTHITDTIFTLNHNKFHRLLSDMSPIQHGLKQFPFQLILLMKGRGLSN
jgi:hypothetical protein